MTAGVADAKDAAHGSAEPSFSVRFVQPLDGQYVRGSIPLIIEAGGERPIDQVSFLQGDSVVGIVLEAPFQLPWETRNVSDGPHTLVAKARDADFREASVRINVTVDNTPPAVAWVAPADGTVAIGAMLLEASASDILGLQAVKFLANGAVVGQVSRSPYRFNWNTETVPNTLYALQARAFDLANNAVTSPVLTVRIANFNRYPSMDPVGPKTVAETSTLAFTISGTDPDAPRDPLSYAAANLPPWATFDPKTRQFRGVPDINEASLEKPQKVYENVRFIVCDPEPLCVYEDIAITVLDANRPPVVKAPGNKRVKEGEPLVFSVTATDPDGDPLTCRTRLLPKWAVFNSKTCTFKGAPRFNVASLDEPLVTFTNVQFEFCDDKPLCAVQAISIDVENVNAPPVWDDLVEQYGEENRLLQFDVSAIDPDEDRPYIKAQALPDGATLVDLGDGVGRITWTPRPDQSGTHTAVLLATDKKLVTTASLPIIVKEKVLSLSGLVLDEENQPVPGVMLKVTSQAETIRIVTTDEHGYYLIDGLESGEYKIKPSYTVEKEFSTEARQQKNPSFSPPVQRITVGEADERAVDFSVKFQD